MPLDPKTEQNTSNAEKTRRIVCCARCQAELALADDRITIGDGSLHTFVNPEGIVFRVLCFAEAEGCVETGAPTKHWTWFPGHAWQIALCRNCRTHVGWRFSGTDLFWGLIEDRLAG